MVIFLSRCLGFGALAMDAHEIKGRITELEYQEAQNETQRQSDIMKILVNHPAVVWVSRMNSGGARVKGRFLRFGFKGCPDIMGQHVSGRLIAIEVKGKDTKKRPEQIEFIEKAQRFGALAGFATSVDEALTIVKGGSLGE